TAGSAGRHLVVQVLNGLGHLAQRVGHLGHTFGGVLEPLGHVVVAVLERPRGLLRLEALLDELVDVALALFQSVVDAVLALVQLFGRRVHLVICCAEIRHGSLPSSYSGAWPIWTIRKTL